MARRSRREKGFWTERKIRGLVAVGFVLWVVTAYEIPLMTYGLWLGTDRLTIDGTYTLHIPDYPPVEYSAVINYSVAGAFSIGVNNPIYMKALVYDANRSDFGDLFNGIGLAFQKVDFANGANGSFAVLPRFHSAGQGRWMAEGEVIFAQQINFTGPVLVPTTTPQNVSLTDIASNVTSQVEAYDYPFPQLQPQSYTDTLYGNEADARYVLMASAILILFLIPIFDRVLLVRDEKEQRGGGAAPAMRPRDASNRQ